jgi:hypothetical protein
MFDKREKSEMLDVKMSNFSSIVHPCLPIMKFVKANTYKFMGNSKSKQLLKYMSILVKRKK